MSTIINYVCSTMIQLFARGLVLTLEWKNGFATIIYKRMEKFDGVRCEIVLVWPDSRYVKKSEAKSTSSCNTKTRIFHKKRSVIL